VKIVKFKLEQASCMMPRSELSFVMKHNHVGIKARLGAAGVDPSAALAVTEVRL